MNGRERRAIREHFVTLVQEINPDEILDQLFKKRLIKSKKYSELIQRKRKTKARFLLIDLRKDVTFGNFLEVLRVTGVQSRTIRSLKNSVRNNEGEDDSSDDSDCENSRVPGKSISQSMGNIVMREVGNMTINFIADNSSLTYEASAIQTNGLRSYLESIEIFDIFENSMLHEPHCYGSSKYPRVTYGLFSINKKEVSEVFVRDESLHVEEKAVVALMKGLQDRQGEKLQVVIYSNWSPCPPCVEVILNFLRWAKEQGLEVELTMKVAALYRMTWWACEEDECPHLSFSQSYHREDHRLALVKLLRHGVSVESFEEESWRTLRKALGIQESERPYYRERWETDEMVARSLRALQG